MNEEEEEEESRTSCPRSVHYTLNLLLELSNLLMSHLDNLRGDPFTLLDYSGQPGDL